MSQLKLYRFELSGHSHQVEVIDVDLINGDRNTNTFSRFNLCQFFDIDKNELSLSVP